LISIIRVVADGDVAAGIDVIGDAAAGVGASASVADRDGVAVRGGTAIGLCPRGPGKRVRRRPPAQGCGSTELANFS
jgi:hypothetical protein